MSVATDGASEADAYVGIDVGGTHTDAAVLVGDRLERGKALTTYGDFSQGVLGAVEVAAERLGMTLDQVLSQTRLLVNGTTVVTNTITELRGARVGVLITRGFKDTLRLAGGARSADFNDHLQQHVPDLVPRRMIVEIEERTDWAGLVLMPVDREQVKAEARRLVEEQGAEALAICFLSSYANGENELAAEAAIRDVFPDFFITASHRVFPIAGETRRFTTAVLNSFVHDNAEAYLESLDEKLRAAQFTGGLAFFQGLGGGISLDKAKAYPLGLLGSGPAGGALGANELAKRMGLSRVLLGDMGGTSFDTGIIIDNEIQIEKNLQLGPFQTGVNLIDVVSVGAGGGSIAWIGDRGVPQVGPQSAGSTPGPAAYGKDGEDPTVTDAMIVLGFIDPNRYLGGRIDLRPDLSRKALDDKIGGRFGWSTDKAAAAVHDLVVVTMANAVREVSVEKGHDSREFVFVAYGGTLPLFAAQVAERLGISTIVIPQNSSVFSALGLLSAEFVMRFDQAVGWDLTRTDQLERVNKIADSAVASARSEMMAEGFESDAVTVQRTADFRFEGQNYELTMPVPHRAITSDDVTVLADDFRALYERTYGAGTAWNGVPTKMVNYSVTVTGHQTRPSPGSAATNGGGEAQAREQREVYLPSEQLRSEIPIYDDARLTPGSRVTGPAIVDASDTTVYDPPGTSAVRDEYMNLVLTR
jgi:N-methylhydantoinase A